MGSALTPPPDPSPATWTTDNALTPPSKFQEELE
jgi:hypothetical protein